MNYIKAVIILFRIIFVAYNYSLEVTNSIKHYDRERKTSMKDNTALLNRRSGETKKSEIPKFTNNKMHDRKYINYNTSNLKELRLGRSPISRSNNDAKGKLL